MAVTDPTNEIRYYGVRDFVNGGYDALLMQVFKDGGLTLYYMTKDGPVENNALIEDLHDADTRPITADEAAKVARERFGQTLPTV
jgi:hypothetical protein